jgi:hypothetical protein
MKVDDVKPTETTEEVSSHGVEKRVKRRESHRNTPGARENRWRTGKTTEKSSCTSVEQDENHEKGPRWSWARNHMGNPSLIWTKR